MKIFSSIVLIGSLGLHISAQVVPVLPATRCPLTIPDSPTLNGLKLGMSPNQITESTGIPIEPVEKPSCFYKVYDPYAGLGMKKICTSQPIGQSEFAYLHRSGEKPPVNDDPLNGFQFAFWNDVLVEYVVVYNINYFDLSKPGSYPTAVAKKLDLPDSYGWSEGTNIRCTGFSIGITNYDNRSIRVVVTNWEAAKKIEDTARDAVKKGGSYDIKNW